MISRSVQVYGIMFREIEPVIRFAIRWGLILGIVLAVGGNLIIDQIVVSYNAFVQNSLIGIGGSLKLKTTPTIWKSIESEIDRLDQDLKHSIVWESQHPIKLELKQGMARNRVQVHVRVAKNNYLMRQMQKNSNCSVATYDSIFAYGNDLLLRLFQQFDPDIPIELRSRLLGKAKVSFHRSSDCRIETGIMTDYPVLFLSWDNLDIDPLTWQKNILIQFNTNNRQETEKLFSSLSNICKRVIKYHTGDDGNLVCEPINSFHSPKMKLADDISIQAGNISNMVQLITLGLLLLILFFSFTMLKSFKINNIRIVRMMGVNRSEVGLAFFFRGARIGLLGTMFGFAWAYFAEFLIQRCQLIPFDHFFVDWDLKKLFLTAGLIPMVTAALSGLIVYISMKLEA